MARSTWSGTITFGHMEHFPHPISWLSGTADGHSSEVVSRLHVSFSVK